jgi:hypothetical protein
MLRRVIPYLKKQSSSIVFEPEYQDVLDYAIANAIDTPSLSINIRNNNRVKYLKAEGLWSIWDLLYFMDQESGKADFAKINYVDPSSNYLSGATQPSFVANSGFKGNGTNQFFQTGYNPQTDRVKLTISSSTVMFKGFDWVADSTVEALCGSRDGVAANQIVFQKPNATQVTFRIKHGSPSISRTPVLINDIVVYCGDTSSAVFYNSVAGNTASTAMSGANFANFEIILFATNESGTALQFCKSGLKYWGIGEKITTVTPRPAIIDTLESIMDDTYTP